MIILDIKRNAIYENLAMEEYVFNKYKDDDVFIFWINEPSVVVGKHQNLLEEVNLKYCYENKIKISRRLSGGGTVYHDFGNLNYTYITNSTGDTGVDFKEMVLPVKNSLNYMGINVEISPRNDLILNGYKVCGHSQYMRKKRVMHHGCILLNANLKNLSGALKSPSFESVSTSVKSVRSKVANIFENIKENYTVEDFKNKLKQEISKNFENSIEIELSENDMEEIRGLSKTKYSTKEWIYGQSPKSKIKFKNCEIEIQDGKINSCENSVFSNIKGKYFCYDELLNVDENIEEFLGDYY